MRYYPINLNLKDQIVLIFGSGKVAIRKGKRFKGTGCKVVLISNKFSEAVSNEFLFINKKIDKTVLHKDLSEIVRDFTLDKIKLVFTATNDLELNESICNWFKARHILTNNVSDYGVSDFISPGVIEKGDITIGVSTNGNSPGITRLLKGIIEDSIPDELIERVHMLGELRGMVRKKIDNEQARKAIMDELIKLDIDQLKTRRQSFED